MQNAIIMKTISAIILILACLIIIPASSQEKNPLAGYKISRAGALTVEEVKRDRFKLANKIFRFEAKLNVASNPEAIAPGVYRAFLGSVQKDYMFAYIDSEKGLKYFEVARKSGRSKNFWAVYRGDKLYLVGRTVRNGVVGW